MCAAALFLEIVDETDCVCMFGTHWDMEAQSCLPNCPEDEFWFELNDDIYDEDGRGCTDECEGIVYG